MGVGEVGGGGPCTGRLPCPGTLVQHPVGVLLPVLKKQISTGGSLRARSPDPAQPSSLREPGVQDPNSPQPPQATQIAVRGPDPADCSPCRWPLILGHRGRNGGEVHYYLKAWDQPVEGSRALQDTAPNLFRRPLSSPDGLRPGELEGPREARTHLLPHFPLDNHHPSDHWQSSATNGCSLWGGIYCDSDQ